MVTKQELILDGKEKRIFSTSDPEVVLIHYKDVATAFGGIKKASLKDKGKFTNRICASVFEELERNGVRTHFLEITGEREQLCRRTDVIPLQLVVRNRLSGTTAKMLGVEEGTRIQNTIFELRYNSDALCDPLINDHHAVSIGIVTYEELEKMYATAARVNDVLKDLFHRSGIELIDFKMEFGYASDGSLLVADEISPDNSRLWDEQTGRKLDKDRFRHDLSDVCASYREVMERLIKTTEQK